MSKASQWAEENKSVAKKQPEKFLNGNICAHVKESGDLQIVASGRAITIPLRDAEALAIWMDKTYGRPYILECVSTRASEEDVT